MSQPQKSQSQTASAVNKVVAGNLSGYTPTTTTSAVSAVSNQTTNGSNASNTAQTDKSVGKKSDKKNGENAVPMNVLYSRLDDNLDDTSHKITLSDGISYRINCYIVPKFNLDVKKRFSPNVNDNLGLRLSFPNQIEKIVLEDRLDSINLQGYIEVSSVDGYLDIFLERHNNFYIVMNISQVYTNDGGNVVHKKYEPYIFQTLFVQPISSPDTNVRKMRIHLIDIITAIMKTHSIANVIHFNPAIKTASSYKSAFAIILDYIKTYIKVNNNNTCQYKKDLLYGPSVLFGGVPCNGNDDGNDMSGLITNTFGKISRNASIYEAMSQFLSDCVTTLKIPKGFGQGFESIGDVLIPFFFKQEYPDKYHLYPSFWLDVESISASITSQAGEAQGQGATTSQGSRVGGQRTNEASSGDMGTMDGAGATTTPAANGGDNEKNNTVNGKETATKNTPNSMFNIDSVTMRQMTMRDFFMPFHLCFGAEKKSSTRDLSPSAVSDVINPTKEDMGGKNLLALNTYYAKSDIMSFQFNPIDLQSVRKIWKNVIFVDCSDAGTGGNSTLIYFRWFYEYFSWVFLNNLSGERVLNVIPDFFVVSRNEKIGNADADDGSFDCEFDKHNAYTYATQTNDTVKECLRHMGRNITSFVLLNDVCTFEIHGNLLRRPNEIIKINLKQDDNGSHSMSRMSKDINRSDYLYLYVRKVTHIFTSGTYINQMTCCKICDCN